jgi:hypothetical protein
LEKYLGSLKLVTGFVSQPLQLKRASPFWKGLVASSPVILHWLRWKPGSGTEIKIGRDKIIGLEDSSLLPPALCSKLCSLNLLNLAQVRIPTGTPSLPDNWMGSSELSFVDGGQLIGTVSLLHLKELASPL